MQSLGLGPSTQNTGLLSTLIGGGNFANPSTGLINPLGGFGGNTGSTLGTLGTLGSLANLGKRQSVPILVYYQVSYYGWNSK